MPKRSKTPGTIVINLKLVLRLTALLCFVLAPLGFLYTMLSFRLVGVIAAVGVICLIYAEFADD